MSRHTESFKNLVPRGWGTKAFAMIDLHGVRHWFLQCFLGLPTPINMPDVRHVRGPVKKGNRRSTKKLPVLQVYGPFEQAFSLTLLVPPLAQELLGPRM
jgi:hypothetical protein